MHCAGWCGYLAPRKAPPVSRWRGEVGRRGAVQGRGAEERCRGEVQRRGEGERCRREVECRVQSEREEGRDVRGSEGEDGCAGGRCGGDGGGGGGALLQGGPEQGGGQARGDHQARGQGGGGLQVQPLFICIHQMWVIQPKWSISLGLRYWCSLVHGNHSNRAYGCLAVLNYCILEI